MFVRIEFYERQIRNGSKEYKKQIQWLIKE